MPTTGSGITDLSFVTLVRGCDSLFGKASLSTLYSLLHEHHLDPVLRVHLGEWPAL